MPDVKLLNIVKSPNREKKYRAYFLKNGKELKRDFGQRWASDYTIHRDKARRNRYITRHVKDIDTEDPTRAGYLSLYILWNKKSFKSSLADYKKRLGIYNETGKFPKNITGYY